MKKLANKAPEKFLPRFNTFFNKVQHLVRSRARWESEGGSTNKLPTMIYDMGNKWTTILKTETDGSMTPFCMVDNRSGDIYRPASMKNKYKTFAVAPRPRGNIFRQDWGMNCVTADGIVSVD